MEKNTKKIETLEHLGTDLMQVYQDLRDGAIELKLAEGLANVAGKIIGAAKVITEVRAYNGSIGHIPLVDEPKKLKAS